VTKVQSSLGRSHTQHQCIRVSDQSECFFSEPMSKMFLKLALLCLLRLVGEFKCLFMTSVVLVLVPCDKLLVNLV